MKSRYSFYKIRFGKIEKLAKRRLGKSPDEGKLKFADIVMFIATCLLFGIHYIPDSVQYNREIEILIAVGIFCIGIFLASYRMAPRPCWAKASAATGTIAVVWSVLPWILLWADEMDVEIAQNLTICSSIMWVIFLGCFLRLRYIRRRSREEIAMMRLREKRRRKAQYL
ncbi:MAG: hypothetical protein J6R16_04950 [Alistipes sp.]|nr:hypothetical protein [Alistipes sp.]